MVDNSVLATLVEEFNSKPCPYCGESHVIKFTDTPGYRYEWVSEVGCVRWVNDLIAKTERITNEARTGIFLQ